MAEKKDKKSSYISAKKSREISRFNRKLTKKLEKERNDAGSFLGSYIAPNQSA